MNFYKNYLIITILGLLSSYHPTYSMHTNYYYSPKPHETYKIQIEEMLPGHYGADVLTLPELKEVGSLCFVDKQVTHSKSDLTTFVDEVTVIEEYQKKGIGNMLLATSLAHLSHATQISLLADSNDQNIQDFYKKRGFTPETNKPNSDGYLLLSCPRTQFASEIRALTASTKANPATNKISVKRKPTKKIPAKNPKKQRQL